LDDESIRLILLTNDDGIDAPGLAALEKATEGLGQRQIVAPLSPISGCAHGVTNHRPIAIVRRGADRYAVDGTPADCVRLALHHLEAGFSWVISGINDGGNLGADVLHSGTVAAVREAAIQGRKGIAVSQYKARSRVIDWTLAARWAGNVVRSLIAMPCEPGMFWNVNLPHADPGAAEPEVVFCPLDPSPLPVAYRLESEGDAAYYCGDYQTRARISGADVELCFGGRITVTLVRAICSVC
jgi:5'-nucleotidase